MWGLAFAEIAAEWSVATLICYLISLTIMRFGFSIRISIWKVVCLFFAAWFLTTGFDVIFTIQNGSQLFDAEPVVSRIPNVLSVPFMASVAALFLAAKYWSGKGEA